MYVKIYFSDSDLEVEDFDFYLSILRKVFNGYYLVTPFSSIHVSVFKGGCHEEAPQKACNEGVRKSRRNKAVKNVSKPS